MAVGDYFLKLEGIEGESADDKHKKEIDIQSFSWGASNSGTMAMGGGGGAGKVTFQDIHFTKNVDKSSPNLLKYCATGKHITKGTLTVRKAGDKQQEYYKVNLTDVMISSYQAGGHGGDPAVTDSFSLNFAKIEFEYFPQNEKGGLEGRVAGGWDLKANKVVG
jgi:type VI secretion system secreted protein Hcp